MVNKLTLQENLSLLRAFSVSAPYATGTDVLCRDVYNVAYGQVVYVGQNGTTYTINVKCNNNEILRYCNLEYVSVNTGMYVSEGYKLGVADKYVHFEYATSWKGSSIFPIRVNELTYYKQDPSDILYGQYEVTSIVTLDYAASSDLKVVDYTDEQKSEFNGGRW